MKKLICAAAMSALCATVFAIESENVVGYQNRGLQFNKFVWCCGTFQSVGAAQEEMTLGAVSLANNDGVNMGEVTLSLFNEKASNLKLTASDTEAFIGKSASFFYLPQTQIDEAKADPEYEGELDGVVAGWYHNTDEEFTECFNNYKLPYGTGYAVKQSANGYAVVYSGAVVKDADMPSVGLLFNKFVWTGNAAPTKMTLGDFTLSNENGVNMGEVTLSLFNEKASNLKLTASDTEAFIGKSASFFYLPQTQIDEAKADPEYEGELDGVVAGWYHNTDEEFTECFNNYEIEAGQGFAVKESANGYSIDLPGAL